VSSSETASALTVSPDGKRVYVANRKAGKLAEIDAEAVTLRRTVAIDLAPDESLTAAASNDGLFIGTGQRVVALDRRLRTDGTWRLTRMVAGLQPSGDGRHLYVSARDRMVIIDLRGGKATLTTSMVPGRLTSVVELPSLDRSGAKCAC
jgi:6-phosphogluconolactonase (cycloisomerase 2 family)